MNLARLVARVEPRLGGQVVEQRIERRDAAAEYAQPLLARSLHPQHLGHVLDDAQVPAQIVRLLAPCLRTLALELAELRRGSFERGYARRGLAALHPLVLRDTLAHPRQRKLGDAAPCFAKCSRCNRGTRADVVLDLVGEALVQRNPFAHDLVTGVALLPALQAMVLGVVG